MDLRDGVMNDLNLLMWQQLFLERMQKAEQRYREPERPVRAAKPVSWVRTRLGNLLIGSGRKIKGLGPAIEAGV